jgi:hypothetical protein
MSTYRSERGCKSISRMSFAARDTSSSLIAVAFGSSGMRTGPALASVRYTNTPCSIKSVTFPRPFHRVDSG